MEEGRRRGEGRALKNRWTAGLQEGALRLMMRERVLFYVSLLGSSRGWCGEREREEMLYLYYRFGTPALVYPFPFPSSSVIERTQLSRRRLVGGAALAGPFHHHFLTFRAKR